MSSSLAIHSQKNSRRRWSCPDPQTLASLTINTNDQYLTDFFDIAFDSDTYVYGEKSLSSDSDESLSPSLSSSCSSSLYSGHSPAPSFHQPLLSITPDDVIHDEDEEGQYLLIPPSNPFYKSKRSPGLGYTSSSATPSPFTGLSPYAFSCDPALASLSPSPRTPMEMSPMILEHSEIVFHPAEVWMERQFLGYRSPAFQHLGANGGHGDGSPTLSTTVDGDLTKPYFHSLLSPDSAYRTYSPLIRVPAMPDVPIDCDEIPE